MKSKSKGKTQKSKGKSEKPRRAGGLTMKAVDLFEKAKELPPKDQPGYVSLGLGEVLPGSPISIWRRGESIPCVARRTLFGVAPYSLPELELLDALLEALQQNPCPEESVQVFDVLTCTTMSDLDECIPGIGRVYQTPVVGIWRSGVLVEKASGAMTRSLVAERFKLDGQYYSTSTRVRKP